MSDDPNDTHVMTTYADSDDDFAPYEDFAADDDAGAGALPGRPRRVLVNRYSALLSAVVIAGACFYAGVRVEKSQVSSGGTSASAAGFGAGRFSAAAGGASSATAAGARAGRAGTGAAAGEFSGAPGGFGTARAGSGTAGTISTISGRTLYITETGGNTVKVNLSSATKLTKTVTVSRKSLYPGDSVTVSGSGSANGAISATAVTDAGSGSSSSSATGASGASGSTSSTSGSSALNSLFGG